jgi:hypothetical protein
MEDILREAVEAQDTIMHPNPEEQEVAALAQEEIPA